MGKTRIMQYIQHAGLFKERELGNFPTFYPGAKNGAAAFGIFMKMYFGSSIKMAWAEEKIRQNHKAKLANVKLTRLLRT